MKQAPQTGGIHEQTGTVELEVDGVGVVAVLVVDELSRPAQGRGAGKSVLRQGAEKPRMLRGLGQQLVA